MASSLGYNRDHSSSKASTPGEIIRDQGTVHRDTVFNLPQTLDQHHPLHHSQLNLPNNKPIRGSSPDIDTDPANNRSNRSAPAPAPAPAPSTAIITVPLIRYRECLKNHAASMGSHVVDGCGEFMPSGEEGTPEALKCAACVCHRNFHRKEIDGESQSQHAAANSHYTCNNQRQQLPPPPPPPPPFHHRISYTTNPHQTASIAPMMMPFGGVGVDESSSEDLNMFQSSAGGQTKSELPNMKKNKKRFRTKFTQEQKDKMMEFAEKLGWRIQKQDDQQVEDFCTQVGVKRQVFKVWMHNHKLQATKKQQHDDE